jgi:hypothetical protein
MSYNKYAAQSNGPLFAYIGQKLRGMRGDEFSIIIESESNIYMKEYGEGDDEEWEEGTEPFTINGKIVYIPPALLGMTQAQLNSRFRRKAR